MQPGKAFDPIRSVQVAWSLLKQAPVTVLIGGLLLWFFRGGGGSGLQFLVRGHGLGDAGTRADVQRIFEQLRPLLLVLIPLFVCLGLAFFAMSSWLLVGFGRAVELGLRTGKDDIAKVFSGGDRFGAMLLARLLAWLIQTACSLPLAAVAFIVVLVADRSDPQIVVILGAVLFGMLWIVLLAYVALGLFFVSPIVALESCSPTEAIARSWKISSGNRLQLLWFAIFQFLLGIAGMCLCCVGTFVTSPLAHVMKVEAYLALTKGAEYPQWWVGSGKFPFDEHRPDDFGSPTPLPVPPPLPPQS
jgi:hypothetical protein